MERSPSTLVLLLWILDVAATRRKILLPIKPEQDLLPSKSQIGCNFDGKIYSLEDTWHPDLGKPFGVAYCVLCRCEVRSRWEKESGKISCKNIRSHCPPPACTNPVEVPGQCCRVCPKIPDVPLLLKKSEVVVNEFEYFQEKDDDLYNDRSYLSSDDDDDDDDDDDSWTEFVAFLTASGHVEPPAKSGLAKAKFSLLSSNMLFSINYKGMHELSRVRFSDVGGSVLFEHPVHRVGHSDTMCGIWRSVPRSSLHLLRLGHIRVSLVTETLPKPEISGKIVHHKALFSESFSALLMPESTAIWGGECGLVMLTLSDGDDNLHFILMLRGIQGEERERILITVQILHHRSVIRALCANVTVQEMDFAEVFPNLSSQEMLWLAQGQLEIAVQMEGVRTQRISGFITVRKSCDTLQSVLSGRDALNPTKAGTVGSATITLHENGTLEYQLQVAGNMSEVTAVTLETRPQGKMRNILHDLTKDYHEGKVRGLWSSANARDLHRLLHSELFFNVATKDFQEGEIRGQITALPYNGLWARHEESPIPLAGQFVLPPLMTGTAGHAWMLLDEYCHLQYQIVVTGLERTDDAALNAHLHSTQKHKRLLKGFYGSQAVGSVKDLDMELFSHLNHGTAFIQVSTKQHPRGEIRGQVHIPNNCKLGGTSPSPDDSEKESTGKSVQSHPEEHRRDPESCYFEGKLRAHGSRWAPDYDRKCSECTCQKRTVICDPIVCHPLHCSQPIQLAEHCCPVCDEKKEILVKNHRRPKSEGCYFNGEWRSAGTLWHPWIEPFGLVLCATCSCKAFSQDLHCVRQTCPHLSCANPIRSNPMDCCKKCPEEEQKPAELAETMQSDEPRQCKVMGHLYSNNERWHPTVEKHGVVPCVTCICLDGAPQCDKQKWKCSDPECSGSRKPDRICCGECLGQEEDEKSRPEEPTST
ncbi:chordin-like [Lithobates pipiens]